MPSSRSMLAMSQTAKVEALGAILEALLIAIDRAQKTSGAEVRMVDVVLRDALAAVAGGVARDATRERAESYLQLLWGYVQDVRQSPAPASAE